MSGFSCEPSDGSFIIREINSDDSAELQGVADAIADAFECDAWFKKEGEARRLSGGEHDVRKIISEKTSTFLVAVTPGAAGGVLGAVRVDWDMETGVGHFGMLGVPKRNGRRGIGRCLVRAVSDFLRSIKRQQIISMPVIFSRNERLIEWYQQLGFHKVGDLFQFPVQSIVRSEYVGMILMQQMECSLTSDSSTVNPKHKEDTSSPPETFTDTDKSSVEPSSKSRKTSNVEPEERPFTFSLCTYNLWKSRGKPACWDVRQHILLRHLRQLDPDVLLVQELCPEISACVLEALPGHTFVKPGSGAPEGWKQEGQIFFRSSIFALVEAGAEHIEQEEPLRRLFWARLRFRDKSIGSIPSTALFATAHFTWQGHPKECKTDLNLRKIQARNTANALNELRSRYPHELQFFGGDLNESFWPKRILESHGFVNCFKPLGLPCRPTHPNRSSLAHEEENADSVLDWLFSRGRGAKPLLATVVNGSCGLSSDDSDEREKLAVVPSDHCPVVAVYRIG